MRYYIAPLDLTERQEMIYRAIYKKADFTTMESAYTYNLIIQDIKSIDLTEKQVRNDIKKLIELEVLTVVKRGTKGNPTIYRITILDKIRSVNGRLNGSNRALINEEIQALEVVPGTKKSLNGNLMVNSNKEKENNICLSNDKKYIESFVELWKIYPKKVGKAKSEKLVKKLLKKYTLEELIRAVQRYSKSVEGKDKQFILQGDTFFNGRFEDYLDLNYEENKPEVYEEFEGINKLGKRIKSNIRREKL